MNIEQRIDKLKKEILHKKQYVKDIDKLEKELQKEERLLIYVKQQQEEKCIKLNAIAHPSTLGLV